VLDKEYMRLIRLCRDLERELSDTKRQAHEVLNKIIKYDRLCQVK